MAVRGKRAGEHEHVVVVAIADRGHRKSIGAGLAGVGAGSGAARRRAPGRYRVVVAGDGEEALRRVRPDVTVLVVDLALPRRSGVEVIRELRPRRPDLAILALTGGAAPSEAVGAILAGADHVLDEALGEPVEHAVELAVDRRRLARVIARSEAEVEEARQRLSQLGSGLGAGLPGLRPPLTQDAVIPFQEAARRYLAAAARLFDGDPRGLAERLGISYFALRRLLRRYGVPFPGRSRKRASGKP